MQWTGVKAMNRFANMHSLTNWVLHRPVGKIAEKAVCRDCLFGDFAHWVVRTKL